VQQDVLRLDVPVDHPLAVGVVQRLRHLGRDPDGVADRQLLLAGEPVPERLARDEGHDVEDRALDLTGVEQRQDVRVLQVGGEPDLLKEALGSDHRRQLGPQDLEGDLTVVPQVLCQVHRGHAALPQLPLEAVAVGQCRSETLHDHRGPRVVGGFEAAAAGSGRPAARVDRFNP